MDRCGGYTLPEMVFVVAIVAATLGYGIPTFRDLGLDAARTREVNFFVHAIYLARSEAIKRNGVVSLCPSRDGELCAPAGTPWHAGWIVFVNRDHDQPAVRDADEDLLRAYSGAVRRQRAGQSPDPVLPAVRAVGDDGHLYLLRSPRRSVRAGSDHQPDRPSARFQSGFVQCAPPLLLGRPPMQAAR